MDLRPIPNFSSQDNNQIYMPNFNHPDHNSIPVSQSAKLADCLSREASSVRVSPIYDSSLNTKTISSTSSKGSGTQNRTNSEKPPYPYAKLIAQAILTSDSQALTLNEIYVWIIEKYPYYKNAASGWKNSIRHNLSLNKMFLRVPRAINEPGKGSYWTINFAAKEMKSKFMGHTRQFSPYSVALAYQSDMTQTARWNSVNIGTNRIECIPDPTISGCLSSSNFISSQVPPITPSHEICQPLNYHGQHMSLPCLYSLENGSIGSHTNTTIYSSYPAESFSAPFQSNEYSISSDASMINGPKPTTTYGLSMPLLVEPQGKAQHPFRALTLHNPIPEMTNLSTCYLSGLLEPVSQEFDQVSQGANRFGL
ncbi:hypothetical protein K7432_003925 [Basidiobolus ranarum]|uniref:Fork-head domain-containing protein n=1 Tax=Basidiobolus ranarum TaxID=34480 RepID=A0ABR2WZ62_9FUNG